MQGLDSYLVVFLYFKRFAMKQATLTLPLFCQGLNSNNDLLRNIALKTKMGHSVFLPTICSFFWTEGHMDRVKRIWYLLPMRAAKVQASLRIRAVSPEPPLLAHTSSESRGTFRQKARSLAHLNGWACAVKICNDGMLEDTNSLDGAHMEGQEHLACF